MKCIDQLKTVQLCWTNHQTDGCHGVSIAVSRVSMKPVGQSLWGNIFSHCPWAQVPQATHCRWFGFVSLDFNLWTSACLNQDKKTWSVQLGRWYSFKAGFYSSWHPVSVSADSITHSITHSSTSPKALALKWQACSFTCSCVGPAHV